MAANGILTLIVAPHRNTSSARLEILDICKQRPVKEQEKRTRKEKQQ
jgi:hypothetical protein